MNKQEIANILKIESPVLMLDFADVNENMTTMWGGCRLGGDEFFWKKHLVDDPIMPGTYQVELMGQLAALLDMKRFYVDETPRLVKIDKVRLYKEVRPDTLLTVVAECKQNRLGFVTCQCEIYNGDAKVANAEIMHKVNIK